MTTDTLTDTTTVELTKRPRGAAREKLVVLPTPKGVGKAPCSQVLRRGQSPISGYVGPNGHGKTLAMILDTIPALEAGRTVLSTVRLVDPVTGEDHRSYVRFEDFDQLLEAEHCDVLFDEVTSIASAQDSAKMDPRIGTHLMQLRKRDIRVRWTAPAWDRAAKPIRQVTQSVTECRGSFSKMPKTEDGMTLWAPKRLFRFRTFSALDFEDWTSGKRDRLAPEVKQWMWGPSSAAFHYYNTLDSVSRVGGITENNRCDSCGGRTVVPVCKCGSH